MTIRQLQRLGCRAMLGGGSLAGVLLGWTGAGTLSAQPSIHNGSQPAAMQSAAPAQRNYLNKRIIQLPIEINAAARASIQEVQLYCKDHPKSAWVLKEKVGPTQKSFTFQAPADGEYWFTMVTVDKQGKSYPSDLRNEPAGLAVIIDTQAPTVELTNLGKTSDGQLIRIEITDANLDLGQVRCSYQAGDNGFRPLEQVAGRPNVYCIPALAVCTGLIRVAAEDLAHNQTTRQEHVKNMKAPTETSTAQPIASNAQPTPVTIPDPKTPNPLPTAVSSAPAIGSTETHQVQRAAPDASVRPALPRPNGSEGPHWIDEKSGDPKAGAEKPRDTVVDNSLVQTANNTPKLMNGPSLSSEATTAKNALKRQIVNSAKVYLDYQIENAAPSNVAKVEVWLTRDQGQSWQKHGDFTGHKSPIEVKLPGDGVYGLTLVASNGGSPAAPPAAGEQPDGLIEVDTTKPSVQINEIQTTFEKGQATVQIRWTAQDKNLAETPVEIYHAATLQGPWLPIAKGLPAEGQHRWTPPAGIGLQTHLQLKARDAAGNVSVCGTLEPVALTPPAPVRAVIRTISVGAPVAPQP